MGQYDTDAGPHITSSGTVRIFWGKGGVGHLGPSDDHAISPSAANGVIAAAKTSQAAFEAALPQSWSTWYGSLSSTRQDEVYACFAAHPGYVT